MVIRAKQSSVDLTPELYENFISKIGGLDKKFPVFTSDKCFIWTGASRSGTEKGNKHGTFNTGNGLMNAHRFSYMLAYSLPQNLPGIGSKDPCPCGTIGVKSKSVREYGHCCKKIIRHVCKEINGNDFDGRCVNPMHMKLGTYEENQHDIRVHKTGKKKVLKGDKTPWATMTNEIATQVWQEIQQREKEKEEGKRKDINLAELGKKYNISKHTLVSMRRGRAWNIITGKSKFEHNERRIERDEKKYQQKILKRKDALVTFTDVVKRQKLTPESAQNLLIDYGNGIKIKELSTKYNLSTASVGDIVHARTFKSLDRSMIKQSSTVDE